MYPLSFNHAHGFGFINEVLLKGCSYRAMISFLHNFLQVSRRDLPYALSKGLSGGTTVAATMMIAHKVTNPVLVLATNGLLRFLVYQPTLCRCSPIYLGLICSSSN